ncbi:MAG TPA: FAD-binding oxidoreductase [Acidimicrobiales bacterium]|nr:FAD-binding oxidoreductase [Acidimicrobiales bacterium]
MTLDAVERHAVWWREDAEARAPADPCPALQGERRVDVCVVGGGFTGLWTAIEVTEAAPGARVALVEARECGYGASGRNGGWATGWHDELDGLVERFGEAEGLRLAARSAWAIDRIESFTRDHVIDCDFRRAGALWTATAPWQLGAWDGAVATCQRLGRGKYLEVLDPADLRARTGSAYFLAGARQTDAASLQPALLVAGLRRVALELGVELFESTPVTGLARSRPAVVSTPRGRVVADAVVLATGAWIASIPELRRAVIPVGSHLVATEPVAERFGDAGCANGELLGDARLMVHYAQVTPAGRVVFGRGGGALGPAGRVLARHFENPAVVASVAADLARMLPAVAGARLTHGWGGPVDRAPGHLPFVGRLPGDGAVFFGAGFSGNGVAPSALVGRILGRLAVGLRDDDTESSLAQGPPNYWPPEPLRSAGGVAVRALVAAAEDERHPWRSRRAHRALRRLVATSVPAALDPRARRAAQSRRRPAP